jgi:hypothetical protein
LDIASVLSGFIEIDITTTIVPRNSVSFLSSLPVSQHLGVVNAECEKPSNKVMLYSKKRVKKYKYHGFFL